MINIDNDLSLTELGTWVEFGGSKFKIAHSSNNTFQRALTRRQQPIRRKIEQGTADPQMMKDIMCQAMAEGLLLDWDKVQDKDGNAVKYSYEIGYKALKNNPDLREFITEFATNFDNFRQEVIENMGKD